MRELLFLAHRAPFPPDRGDKIRSCNVLRHLSERARVHLVAFGERPADLAPPPELAERLASWTIVPRTKSRARAGMEAFAWAKPLSVTAFADRRFAAAVSRVRARRRLDATYIFSGQMAQYAGPEPTVMDFVDVDSAKFAQLAGAARLPMRPLLRREARLLGAFERETAARVGASLFATRAEAALFERGGARGRVLAVENGIDSIYFDPAAPFERLASRGPLLVFTGQMDYRPNVDGAAWFARDVLPKLKARRPDARFAIVGRAPTREVRALDKLPGVEVIGAVPDVRPWLAAADVVLAPLLIARGVQNKVLEAMGMARPVVATPAAAEGIDHGGALRIASDDFAQAVRALLDDPAGAESLGRAARAQVIARYGWPACLRPLDALLGLDEPPCRAA